jgi:hypothetical protein
MQHIDLSVQGDAVKQFFLSLPLDPDGSVVEQNGKVLAHVFAIRANGPDSEGDARPWTETQNQRRCDLIDKEIDEQLTPAEARELVQLQAQFHRHLRRIAPQPLEDTRRLHEELLAKAKAAQLR